MRRGLNFCPAPRANTKTPILEAASKFNRRIKLAHRFRNSKYSFREKFTFKSDWTPPDSEMPPVVLETIKNIEKDLSDISIVKEKRNLLDSEFKALKAVKNNPDIIIKPADKGSSVVVMNRSDYVNEGYRLLNDTKYYERIPEPIYPETADMVADILLDLKNRGYISQKQLNYLTPPENPRPRHFYMLPKIHKPLDKWPTNTMPPGRPIISNCSSETDHVSEYIDSFLKPLSCLHPSYIKDTTDFRNKLQQAKVTKKSLIATIDVSNMYTNIDHLSGLQAVREAFDANPNPRRPDEEILRLLEISLTRNDFDFDGKTFLQKVGTAMGARYAPSYANIFMAKFERDVHKKCFLKPDVFFRFLDDIFIIWNHSKESLDEYIEILNSHHPYIKFTVRCEEISNDYLDLTVFKGPKLNETGNLDTKIFFKPTDTHSLLNKSSFHPKHVFRGILKSQILRFYRNCSQMSDFNEACSILFSALRSRHYSRRFLRLAKSEVLREVNSGVAMAPPGVISNSNNDDDFFSEPCGSPFCSICRFVDDDRYQFISNSNKFVYKLSQDLNCNSTNVIYLVTCSQCGLQYVGETGKSLRYRAGYHRRYIQNFETYEKTSINTHFNENSICCLDDFKINPIYRCPRLSSVEETTDNRKNIENFFIEKFKTYRPYGLNKAFKKFNDVPSMHFIVPYSSTANLASKIVKNHFEKLQESMPSVYPHNVITAYSRNKNLKDMLVSSKLKTLQD